MSVESPAGPDGGAGRPLMPAARGESSAWLPGTAPAPARARPQPGFGEAVLLLMVMFTASALALVLILLGGRGTELDIALLGAIEILGLTLGLVAGLRTGRVSWREAFLPRRVPIWMPLLTIPLGAAAAIAGGALDGLVGRLVPVPDAVALEMARVFYAGDAAGWVRVSLSAAVLIPLAEELFFRGLLLRGFVLRYGRGRALALTALLFALVHLNPWSLVSITLAGWLLGWLVLRTGSLWCAWLAHGVYNLMAVLSLNAALDGPPTAAALARPAVGPLDAPFLPPLALGVIALSVWLLARHGRPGSPWPDAPAPGGWTATVPPH